MAQSGFTPIQHYRSATPAATPSAGNLAVGELALNYADGNLFFKDTSNIVRLLASTAAATGTVSSVQASGGTTGLTFTGGPITTSGTLTLGGTLAVANGGTGATTAPNARTNLGATTVGSNFFTLTNPSAITFPRINADNTVSALDAASFRTAIGAGSGGGSVTSVDVSGGTTGLTFGGGPITNSGTITMGGTLGVANGGTGVTTSTGTGSVVLNNGPTFSAGATFNGNVTVSGASVTATNLVATGEVTVGNNSGDPFNNFRIDGFADDFAIIAASGVGAAVGTSISFRTAPAGGGELDRMRITAAGDVGIGTASPFANALFTGLTVGGSKRGLVAVKNAAGVDTGYVFAGTDNSVNLESAGAGPVAINTVNAQPVTITTNTVERMRIDASGNVGIGTTAPAYKLTAQRSAVAGNGVVANLNNPYTYGTGVGTAAATLQFTRDPNTAGAAGVMAEIFGGNEAEDTSTSGYMAFGTRSGAPNSTTERMRITSSGNVGIGTSSPASPLDVATNSSALGVAIRGRASDNVGALAMRSNDGATIYGQVQGRPTDFRLEAGSSNVFTVYTSSTERMRIDNSGNVGLGTTNPGWKLEVAGGSTDKIRLFNTVGNGNTIDFLDQAWQCQIAGSAGNLLFNTGGTTERMRIDNGGNVGIGTAGGAYKFEVASASAFAASFSGPVNTFLQVTDGTVTGRMQGQGSLFAMGSSSNHPLTLITNTAERMRIDTAGNVGIGTTSPETNLDVAGPCITRGDANGFMYFAPRFGTQAFGANYDRFEIRVDTSTQVTSLGNTHGGTGSPRALAFWAANSERMRIDTAGNVGIGTSSPGARLDVAGNLRFSAANPVIELNNGGPQIYTTVANTLQFATGGGIGTPTERMRIDNSGNVGIGTSGPGARVDIVGPALTLAASSTYALWVANSGGANGDLAMGSDGSAAYIQSFGGKTLRLNNQGNSVAFGGDVLTVSGTGGITSANLADAVGYKGLPQNSQTTGYTLVLADQGKHISITTGGVTIPANGTTAFPIGTTIVVYNDSASTQTIAITTDTLRLAGTATTGARTLAQRGLCTLVKVKATEWVATGNVT